MLEAGVIPSLAAFHFRFTDPSAAVAEVAPAKLGAVTSLGIARSGVAMSVGVGIGVGVGVGSPHEPKQSSTVGIHTAGKEGFCIWLFSAKEQGCCSGARCLSPPPVCGSYQRGRPLTIRSWGKSTLRQEASIIMTRILAVRIPTRAVRTSGAHRTIASWPSQARWQSCVPGRILRCVARRPDSDKLLATRPAPVPSVAHIQLATVQ